MIFQEPMSSLNPCFTVGYQIGEALRRISAWSQRARAARVVELLAEVGIPDPARRARAFPHQLSGGMSQRVMIAMALACKPQLLIADEPTTALDVTIQAQILDLLLRLQRERGMGLVLITHDMGVVAETADRVHRACTPASRSRRTATATLFADPQHPYTAALLAALPERATARRLPAIPGVVPGIRSAAEAACSRRAAPTPSTPAAASRLPRPADWRRRCHAPLTRACLSASARRRPHDRGARGPGPARDYAVSRGAVPAAGDGKALPAFRSRSRQARTLAVVGESGCGKSTLARLADADRKPTAGGADRSTARTSPHASGAMRQRLRREMQMVFQNPYGSLNPRQTIGKPGGAAARQHRHARRPSAGRRRWR